MYLQMTLNGSLHGFLCLQPFIAYMYFFFIVITYIGPMIIYKVIVPA